MTTRYIKIITLKGSYFTKDYEKKKKDVIKILEELKLENEHINLDKLVSTVFEVAIFEILTSD